MHALFFNCIFSLFFMWRLITWLFDILLYWYLLWFHCRQIQEMPLELQVLESRQCQGMPVYLGKWSKFSLWGSETLLCTLICRYDCLSCLHRILNNDMENGGFRRMFFFCCKKILNLVVICYLFAKEFRLAVLTCFLSLSLHWLSYHYHADGPWAPWHSKVNLLSKHQLLLQIPLHLWLQQPPVPAQVCILRLNIVV